MDLVMNRMFSGLRDVVRSTFVLTSIIENHMVKMRIRFIDFKAAFNCVN